MHFYEIKFLRFSFFFCYRIFRGEQRYSLQHVSTIRLLITNIFLNVFTIKIDKCTVRAHYYIVKIGLSVFFIAQRYVSAVYAVVVSVRLFVTSRHCTTTAKRRFTKITP